MRKPTRSTHQKPPVDFITDLFLFDLLGSLGACIRYALLRRFGSSLSYEEIHGNKGERTIYHACLNIVFGVAIFLGLFVGWIALTVGG